MKRFVAVFLVAASVVFGSVGQAHASEGETKLVRLWGGDVLGGYAGYLSASDAREAMGFAHNTGGTIMAGSQFFSRLFPQAGIPGATMFVWGDAIRRCSDEGKNGVIIYGIRHKVPFGGYAFLPTHCTSQG